MSMSMSFRNLLTVNEILCSGHKPLLTRMLNNSLPFLVSKKKVLFFNHPENLTWWLREEKIEIRLEKLLFIHVFGTNTKPFTVAQIWTRQLLSTVLVLSSVFSLSETNFTLELNLYLHFSILGNAFLYQYLISLNIAQS